MNIPETKCVEIPDAKLVLPPLYRRLTPLAVLFVATFATMLALLSGVTHVSKLLGLADAPSKMVVGTDTPITVSAGRGAYALETTTTTEAPGEASSSAAEEESSLSLRTQILMAVVLLCLSATFAGLTLGIMGIDTLALEIIASAAEEPDRSYAKTILPVRHLGHQTLCTLILGNMWANVMISKFCAGVIPSEGGGGGDGMAAILGFLLSTGLTYIFAEVLPMSVCTGPYALRIAAAGVPVLRVFLVLLYPVAKPLGWVLDNMLHHDPGQVYDRNELRRLIMVHAETHGDVSGLRGTEADLMMGAFELGDKTARDIMTPLEKVVTLRTDDVLTANLLRMVWETGLSRLLVVDATSLGPRPEAELRKAHLADVPVPDAPIWGILYVKDLVMVSPEQALTVAEVVDLYSQREVYSVSPTTKTIDLVSAFQSGVAHLAVVRREVDDSPFSPVDALAAAGHKPAHHSPTTSPVQQQPQAPALRLMRQSDRAAGVITIEDVVECLIRGDILDEYDVAVALDSPIEGHGTGRRRGGYTTHFFEFSVTNQDVARIPASAFADGAGAVAPAESLTPAQMRSLARFLQDGVTAFTFWDTATIEDLVRRASIELRVPAGAAPTGAATTDSAATPAAGTGSSPVLTQAFLNQAAADPALVLYRKGEPTKYFTVILSGRVRMVAGAENFASDLRTMSRLGEAALFDRSIATTPNFVPEFTAFVIEPTRVLRISRDEYIAAFERARNRPPAVLPAAAVAAAGSRPSAPDRPPASGNHSAIVTPAAASESARF